MSAETFLLCFCTLFLIKACAWMCLAVSLKWDLDLEREKHQMTWDRLQEVREEYLRMRFEGAVEPKEGEG